MTSFNGKSIIPVKRHCSTIICHNDSQHAAALINLLNMFDNSFALESTLFNCGLVEKSEFSLN